MIDGPLLLKFRRSVYIRWPTPLCESVIRETVQCSMLIAVGIGRFQKIVAKTKTRQLHCVLCIPTRNFDTVPRHVEEDTDRSAHEHLHNDDLVPLEQSNALWAVRVQQRGFRRREALQCEGSGAESFADMETTT